MVAANDAATDPVATLEAKGGSMSVYADRIEITRSSGSMFEDKQIPLTEVDAVVYERGVFTGHVQVRQRGVEADTGGLLSHPVDENTLHFPRRERETARELRDAILERADVQ